jgi:primosomal replication protein N''
MHEGEETGFFVKNVENVQGDERDIMLFSTTFGRDAQGRFYRRFGALGQVGGERRLNVAITRAKEKVILVTSMPLHEISDALATGNPPDKPRDYLQLYLDFANKISQGEINTAFLSARKLSAYRAASGEQVAQDGFVRSVAGYLQEQGYPSTPATDSDDSFQLDLAIEHPQTGLFALGIECDSPQHFLLAPASAREIWRPSILRQSVGKIHRINSRDWYHDNEQEKVRLLAVVERVLRKE